MKLGIFLVVLGALIGAAGVVAWTLFGYNGTYQPSPQESVWLHLYSSSGLGATVFGGALFITGIIRIIVKR